MAVTDFAVAVSDAPRGSFPYEFPSVGTNLEAVAVIPCFVLIAHETEEGHVYRSYSKLKRFEVQAEVVPKTLENRQHPRSIFNFSRVRLNIPMVECAPSMHVYPVIIP